MHDDDLISLLHEVHPCYLACRSTLFVALSHQHDTRIPEEELLHQLYTQYTLVTCSIPREHSRMRQMSPINYQALIASSDLLKCCISFQGGVYFQENKGNITSADAVVMGLFKYVSNKSVLPKTQGWGMCLILQLLPT